MPHDGLVDSVPYSLITPVADKPFMYQRHTRGAFKKQTDHGPDIADASIGNLTFEKGIDNLNAFRMASFVLITRRQGRTGRNPDY